MRVSPKCIFFCVAERVEDEVNILVIDKIIVPIALEIPDKLSFLRILLYTIINQYQIDHAIMRRIEDNSKTVDVKIGRASCRERV